MWQCILAILFKGSPIWGVLLTIALGPKNNNPSLGSHNNWVTSPLHDLEIGTQ